MDDSSAIDTVIDLDVITPVGQAKVDTVPSTSAPVPTVMAPLMPVSSVAPPIPSASVPLGATPSANSLPESQKTVITPPKTPALINPLFENPDSVGLVKR